MIKIRNLEKNYGETKVLKDISTTINKGEIYGLVGSSGAGKSTLLRCINGLNTYDSGNMLVNGIEVGDLSKEELREFGKAVGMIFQQFSLLERLNVYDNVALPMRCWRYSESEIEETVNYLLEIVGLSNKKESRPRELSGGQKQRVAIARALTMNPKILLCDEITSALDPKISQSILSLLKDINLKTNLTIVIVAHDMDVIRQVCHRMAILNKGVLVEEDSVEDLFIKNPIELQDLLGEDTNKFIPESGESLKIILRESMSHNDIYKTLSKLAIDTEIEYRYVWGGYRQFRNKKVGSFIINVDTSDDAKKIKEYLSSNDIEWGEI